MKAFSFLGLFLLVCFVFPASADPAATPSKQTLDQRIKDLQAYVDGTSLAEDSADASYKIEPYGGLNWNDGLFTIIQKLKTIPGLEYLALDGYLKTALLHPQDIAETGIDLRSIKRPDDLTGLLLKALRSNEMARKEYLPDGQFAPGYLRDYKDAAGNNKKFFFQAWFPKQLVAGPIYLAGHPFMLTLYFLSDSSGFAMEFPQRCLHFPYESGLVPLVMERAVLTSDSLPSDTARNAIAVALAKKYSPSDPSFAGSLESQEETTLSDNSDPGPSLHVDFKQPVIEYDFPDRPDLDHYYQNHVRKLEEASSKNVPDGLKGL